MEFGAKVNKRIASSVGTDGKEKEFRPIEEVKQEQLDLNMYIQAPSKTISVEEFQTLGKQRLSLLRALQSMKEKHGGDQKNYVPAVVEELRKFGDFGDFFAVGPLASKRTKAREDDLISHFVLRLAVCQSPEMSEWLVKMETELFRFRFARQSPQDITAFLRANKFNPEQISVTEKSSMLSELSHALTLPIGSLPRAHIFKISCWEVVDLFASHRLHLSKGHAYIASDDLVALVAPQFRQNIAQSLVNGRRNIGILSEEEWLPPTLKSISNGGIPGRRVLKNGNSEEITPEMVDELARDMFPPCMRNIHSRLRKDHHLKYGARQQYVPFLKEAGLSLESSLEFFRSEFTKLIDGDKFAKEYAYNIRHMYGKEGKRVETKPMSCMNIILDLEKQPKPPTDCHGCPFKHSEPADLSKQLQTQGFQNDQIEDILQLSKMNRPDKACTKYFEVSHGIPDLEELITHPNQYFNLSKKAHRGELRVRSTSAADTADLNMTNGSQASTPPPPPSVVSMSAHTIETDQMSPNLKDGEDGMMD